MSKLSKKMSKGCQNVLEKLSKVVKKMSKICQKKMKRVGEREGEEGDL
jgi:prolyl-tRNA synthetase